MCFLFLTSCNSNIENLEETIETVWVEDNFSKKLECAKIDFTSDIENNWWRFAENYSINEVFYSSSENTCIWVITLYWPYSQNVWIYDILEKRWLLEKVYDVNGTCRYTWEENLIQICNFWRERFLNTLNNLKK